MAIPTVGRGASDGGPTFGLAYPIAEDYDDFLHLIFNIPPKETGKIKYFGHPHHCGVIHRLLYSFKDHQSVADFV